MADREREKRKADKALREQLDILQAEYTRGKIGRRQFIRHATLLGLSVAAAEALSSCSPAATATPVPTAVPPKPAATSAPQPTDVPAPEPTAAPAAEVKDGWGIANYPYPRGVANIDPDEMKCVGCGICEMACSMFHFGVINKELARIQVRKYLVPLPKGVQTTCCQCDEEERECQKACPLDPPAITFDEEKLHLVIDEELCLGYKCNQCGDACPSHAIRTYPEATEFPFVCDLCEVDGVRQPNCVDVCPCEALYFRRPTPVDNWRIASDDKAELIARRLFPLPKTSMGNPGWR